MIVTLTANPSLDRTITLEGALRPGEVQSASSVREDAGGKGINVARVVAAAGVDTIAVLPLADDDPFDTALRVSRLRARRVPITGHVRANLTITDPAGVTTKLNLPGATLDAVGSRGRHRRRRRGVRRRTLAGARRIPAAGRRRRLLRRGRARGARRARRPRRRSSPSTPRGRR